MASPTVEALHGIRLSKTEIRGDQSGCDFCQKWQYLWGEFFGMFVLLSPPLVVAVGCVVVVVERT